MRLGRAMGAAGAIALSALAMRCDAFSARQGEQAAGDGGGDERSEAMSDAPSGPSSGTQDGSGDAATLPPLTMYCPAPAGSCLFQQEVCCPHHSTPKSFAANDAPSGKCIEPARRAWAMPRAR
jgi:hypothetical protein